MTYASIHKAYNYTRKRGGYWLMVFDATFTNISAISWRSVLLEEKTNDMPHVSDNIYHINWYQVHITMSGIRTHN